MRDDGSDPELMLDERTALLALECQRCRTLRAALAVARAQAALAEAAGGRFCVILACVVATSLILGVVIGRWHG